LPAPLLIELLSTRRKFYFLAFSGTKQRKISQNRHKSGAVALSPDKNKTGQSAGVARFAAFMYN